MALKLLKEWIVKNCSDAKNSFKDFVNLVGKTNEVMNENEVWEACRKISLDITEQQAQELFRLLDSNKDGLVTKDDWDKNITFDSNYLIKDTVELIRRKNYKSSNALKKMGLQGVSQVDIHVLREALQKLNEKLTDAQAMFLSRYISKGKNNVPIENVLEILNLAEAGSAVVDE